MHINSKFLKFWRIFSFSLFLLGGLGVILFLDGYEFDVKSRDIQRTGYVVLSSAGSSIYKDEEFLDKNFFYDFLPIGKYSFCFSALGKQDACFFNQEVQNNDEKILSRENIFLLPLDISRYIYEVTDFDVIFDPQKRGVLWFNKNLNQVVFFDGSLKKAYDFDDEIESLTFNPFVQSFEILFQSGLTQFFEPDFNYIFTASTPKKRFYEYSFYQNELALFQKYAREDFSPSIFFDLPIDQVYPIGETDAFLLRVDNKIFIGRSSQKEIRFFANIDSQSPFFLLEKTGVYLWQYEKKLFSFSL